MREKGEEMDERKNEGKEIEESNDIKEMKETGRKMNTGKKIKGTGGKEGGMERDAENKERKIGEKIRI